MRVPLPLEITRTSLAWPPAVRPIGASVHRLPAAFPRGILAVALAAAFGLACPLAWGGVHKCSGAGGTPVYQESSCAPGKELRNFDMDPPPLSVVPGFVPEPTPRSAATPTAPPARSPARPTSRGSAGAARGDSSERRHVHGGMTEGEVLARLGRPDARSGGKKGRSVWTYLPATGDAQTMTSISFEHGVVAGVERKVVRK